MENKIDFDERLKQEATKDYAISVLKQLEQLSGLGKETRTRWIWELLQNARDASIDIDNQLIISVSYNSDKGLEFLHNGRAFTVDEVMRLIFPGSTKYEDEGTIGRFGTGFLTTHRLSSKVKVSGKLEETDQWFHFQIVRKKGASVDTTQKSMHKAWKDFQDSLSDSVSIPEGFTTRFIYPINKETVEDAVTAEDAVEAGINTLKQFAPFVVISNREFTSINIANQDEKLCFKVENSKSYKDFETQLFTVTDGKSEIKKALLVAADNSPAREKTSVVAPLKFNGNDVECLEIKDTPRLFLGLPLVGTETFSFPTVINNLVFEATMDRDDILPDSDKNKKIIENACSLLVTLLRFSASKGWYHVCRWAEVPAISEQKWINSTWLKTCIEEKFIAEIINTPVVLNGNDHPIPPHASVLPIADNDSRIVLLWMLLDNCREFRDNLPRVEETVGWCKTIKSWKSVNDGSISQLSGAIIDGHKLVEIVDGKWHCLEDLQSELQEDVCAIDWLNRLHQFLKFSEIFDEDVQERNLFLNQEGYFSSLTNLYQDKGIDAELKDIADSLNWPIRPKLRDTRLSSVEHNVGSGSQDNSDVLVKLIIKLRERSSNEKSITEFKKTGVNLFAWIVRQENKYIHHLSNFPVFAADGKNIFNLPSTEDSDIPMAPISAWPEELQKYSDLFPPDHIMNNAYFEVLPNRDTWKKLDEKKLVRLNVIDQHYQTDLRALSPNVYENEEDKKDHNVDNPILVTDIVKRDAIMTRLNNGSQARSYLFWQFLTEWLVKTEVTDLEKKQASCVCAETHEYYPVAWLKDVRKKFWIRDKQGLRDFLTTESLGKLLREKEWDLAVLNEKTAILLLEAIGIRPKDLRLEVIVEDEERRDELVDLATRLHVDNVSTDQILEITQDLKEDNKLPQILEERRKNRRTWEQNQHLGTEVENLVREILEIEGFRVTQRHKGADFKIKQKTATEEKLAVETGTLTTLDIKKDNRSWLVEVKATRTENEHTCVRMSTTQAKEAEKESERFLLCVVPIGQETTNLNNVRQKMLFIEDIGERIEPHCKNLDDFKAFRENITTETHDFELVVEAGNAGVLVKKTVWDADGFPLEKLAERLK